MAADGTAEATSSPTSTEIACTLCGCNNTPQWRYPGPNVLCNACGIKHARRLRKRQAIAPAAPRARTPRTAPAAIPRTSAQSARCTVPTRGLGPAAARPSGAMAPSTDTPLHTNTASGEIPSPSLSSIDALLGGDWEQLLELSFGALEPASGHSGAGRPGAGLPPSLESIFSYPHPLWGGLAATGALPGLASAGMAYGQPAAEAVASQALQSSCSQGAGSTTTAAGAEGSACITADGSPLNNTPSPFYVQPGLDQHSVLSPSQEVSAAQAMQRSFKFPAAVQMGGSLVQQADQHDPVQDAFAAFGMVPSMVGSSEGWQGGCTRGQGAAAQTPAATVGEHAAVLPTQSSRQAQYLLRSGLPGQGPLGEHLAEQAGLQAWSGSHHRAFAAGAGALSYAAQARPDGLALQGQQQQQQQQQLPLQPPRLLPPQFMPPQQSLPRPPALQPQQQCVTPQQLGRPALAQRITSPASTPSYVPSTTEPATPELLRLGRGVGSLGSELEWSPPGRKPSDLPPGRVIKTLAAFPDAMLLYFSCPGPGGVTMQHACKGLTFTLQLVQLHGKAPGAGSLSPEQGLGTGAGAGPGSSHSSGGIGTKTLRASLCDEAQSVVVVFQDSVWEKGAGGRPLPHTVHGCAAWDSGQGWLALFDQPWQLQQLADAIGRAAEEAWQQ